MLVAKKYKKDLCMIYAKTATAINHSDRQIIISWNIPFCCVSCSINSPRRTFFVLSVPIDSYH